MEKILVHITNKEIERKLNIELTNDYFLFSSYLDIYNYLSIIHQHKPSIIITSTDDYLLLSKLASTEILIIYIKDKEVDLAGLRNIDNLYIISKNSLDNIRDYINIIFKDYLIIKNLKDKIASYKEKEEENRFVKKAKLHLMEKGMSEDDAYRYIIESSMKKRITKKEMSIKILNE